MEKKKCNACGVIKELWEFPKHGPKYAAEYPNRHQYKGICKKCRGKYRSHPSRRAVARDRYHKTKNKHLARHKKRRRELRLTILQEYGGTPPKCACCGETAYEFLTIDHKYGDGADHRRRITGAERKGGGDLMYRWLRDNGFPQDLGIRVLCWNCNSAIHFYGRCPHERR